VRAHRSACGPCVSKASAATSRRIPARDPQKTADNCHTASEPYRPSCYFGAAKALVDWTATTEAAFSFCHIVGHERAGRRATSCGEEIATLLASLPSGGAVPPRPGAAGGSRRAAWAREFPRRVDFCSSGLHSPASMKALSERLRGVAVRPVLEDDRNPGMPLDLDVIRALRVNRSAVERRAATIPPAAR